MANTQNANVKMAPHNLEAEQAVLGCVLLDEDASVHIISKLQEMDFYSEIHRLIFSAMKAIYNRNQPIDFVTITEELDKRDQLAGIGGTSYLTTLSNVVPSAVNHQTYAEIVKKNAVLRSLISVSEKIIQKAYEDGDETTLAFAEGLIFDLSQKGQTSELVKIDSAVDTVLEKFEQIFKDQAEVQGLSSGFWALDNITNGLHNSDLVLIAARPGVGKTSLAMNIVTNTAIQKGAKCAVFSLEMPKEQLAQRMLCSVANVDMSSATKGKLKQADWTKLWQASKKLKEAKIFVDDSSLNTPSSILSKCRKIKREKGLDLIMIDYLQLMSGDSKKTNNRQEEISEISRKMKILAKEMQVPVLLLSQLSRAVESRSDHRPVLSDLRESGAIEQDADIVMFIHKKEMYGDAAAREANQSGDYVAEIIFAKHRNGALGSAFIGWKGSNVSFVNLPKDANTGSLMQNAPTPPPANPEDFAPSEVVDENISDIFGEE